MTAPKKPQDRQPKKPTVKDVGDGKRVTFPEHVLRVVDGKPEPLAVTVPLAALDDFELLDDLRAIDVDQNASRLPGILRKLIGDDYRNVMDALRDKTSGRVTVEAGTTFIKDLFEAVNPNS